MRNLLVIQYKSAITQYSVVVVVRFDKPIPQTNHNLIFLLDL